MKKEKLIRALGEVDERFIDEAAPVAARKRSRALFFPLIAATLILAVTLSSVLFILVPLFAPSPAGSQGGDYSAVINKLSAYIDKQNEQNKNDNLWDSPSGVAPDVEVEDALPPADVPEAVEPTPDGTVSGETNGSPDQSYEEVTDNQVEGVIEADIIKRSDKYAYYLYGGTVSAYSIAGESSKKLTSIDLLGSLGYNASYEDWDMYLSADCKTLTVLKSYYDRDAKGTFLELTALDVSSPESGLTVKNSVKLEGSYLSSRMTGGYFLVMTQYRVDIASLDFKDPATFVPSVEFGGEAHLVPGNCILLPDELTDTRYTVAVKLNADTLALEGAGAFLSYSQDVYVSKNAIYAMKNYTQTVKENGMINYISMCDVAVLDYSSSELTPKGSIALKGSLKDQYSLDEFGGVLRAVTTTSETKYKEVMHGNSVGVSWVSSSGTNASLYCVDLATMKVISSVENFAPNGETVQSVRFDGNTGYVCTAIRLSDPVYFFDLSDVRNVTYKETDPIVGYSSSLVNWGDGYLLGIGVGSFWDSLKLEVYEEAADKIVSVTSFELTDLSYSSDYKAYYIDRENRLIGLGICSYDSGRTYSYLLLTFNGYKIREVLNVKIGEYLNYDDMRGFYADGYFYIFAGNTFKAINIG